MWVKRGHATPRQGRHSCVDVPQVLAWCTAFQSRISLAHCPASSSGVCRNCRLPEQSGGSTVTSEAVAVSDCFTLSRVAQNDAWWFHTQIKAKDRGQMARIVAVDIVRRLLEPCPEAFEQWEARSEGGPAHDAATKEVLEAYLLADFADAGNATRLRGAVVEHLWACLATDLDGGWGRPFHVEHEHFSVIDHGGDGLSIYDLNAPSLGFRLWESKQYSSVAKSFGAVVTAASDQLKSNGPEYLARMSKPLQLSDDQRIQQLAGTIVKRWTTNDPVGGVGVSVGTGVDRALPKRPFRGLQEAFEHLPTPEHREGLIIKVTDLAGFASEVRDEICKGID